MVYSAGELNGASVDQNGKSLAHFNNGEIRIIAHTESSTFASPEGLSRMGNNMFPVISSGQATLGLPTLGVVVMVLGVPGQSNVNITSEFVRLIEAQRGFRLIRALLTRLINLPRCLQIV
jgi:flagellar hook protein FlgE